VNKLISRVQRPAAPTTKICPECMSEIPIGAKRCAHCTSALAA
jgi:large conductance mechanosensitive channel